MSRTVAGAVLAFGLALAGVPAGTFAAPPLGLPPVPIPADNPQSPEKISLGKRLFEDKRFSGDGTVSCSNCHDPAKAFADGLPVAEGIRKQHGARNSPTVINAAYYESQFWDGRRPSLEAQSKDPFLNPVEHGLTSHEPILATIRGDKDYPGQFRHAFGVEPAALTIDHVAKAIAAFERTVIAGDSPFDRYLYGGERGAIPASAIRGLDIFRTKGRCQDCHSIGQTTALFTDNKFHNIGAGFSRIAGRYLQVASAFRKARQQGKEVDKSVITDRDASELGRFVVTLRPSDLGRFKTSSLRNIAVTGPYMHDGSMKTMEEVVEFYNKGGEQNPFLDSGIRPLNLTAEEKADLVAFLKTLTSPQYANLAQP
ncbi:cytochrome c551 peroxidase [Geotalea uraniireducens]|uniref:Cytochrome c551 peroxidase n=1 Tax=Geotalea uraniireducens TaxID=351604 RepID=A0ABM8ELH7_9BACT|nr:cytochrome c peroxidase [Geotalea uraniireducens]BDV42876.1 cytochrome c551 peroxidase [Geotalea uraniireducens]